MDSSVHVLSKTPITFDGTAKGLERFFRLVHWRLQVGDRSDAHIVWRRGEFVLPVALTKDGQIVLVKEAKKAAERVLWGLPAGGVKSGEDPCDAAMRELESETGFGGGAPRLVASYFNNPDKSTERQHIVLIEGVSRRAAPQLDPGEDIFEVQTFPLLEALQLIEIGLHRLALLEVNL